MTRHRVVPFLLALLLGMAPASSFAQLTLAKDAPIVYGHHHLNVTSVEEHKKFWVTALGGVPGKLGNTDIVKFPNVLVVLGQRAPAGGSKGSTADHIGFQVQNLRATVDRLKAGGFSLITMTELPPKMKAEEQDGIAFMTASKNSTAFAMGPDGQKVEIIENKALAVPVALHHIHFFTPQVDAMKAWYEKAFGAKVPGVTLAFRAADGPVAGTRGRVTDHIGFEIRNLEAFIARLEGMGIKPARPYAKAGTGVGYAFITDPWGTSIELTEGFDKVE